MELKERAIIFICDNCDYRGLRIIKDHERFKEEKCSRCKKGLLRIIRNDD